jgi:hypothetical protein
LGLPAEQQPPETQHAAKAYCSCHLEQHLQDCQLQMQLPGWLADAELLAVLLPVAAACWARCLVLPLPAKQRHPL